MPATSARWPRPDPASRPPPWGQTIDLTGRAHRAGVPLVVGTDAGNPAVFHGLAVHRELELLVRAGLSPSEAVTAASARAADKVGAGARLGTVEPGKEADLLVVGASPLHDVRNIRYPDLVVKRGRLFDPAALAVP
jgi:imidazolonepropionase-like amidohydrolase